MGRERPPRPSQLFLSARFTETCHTSSSSTGTKAVDAGESKTKETEGERRGERKWKKKRKERGKEEELRRKEGEKVGENVKKVSLNFPRI